MSAELNAEVSAETNAETNPEVTELTAETIVVGGGIAGMSCALKLKENGRDVMIITDELGGRVCYRPDLDSNFGAVFYMDNYTHSKKIVTSKGPLNVKLGDLMLHTSPTKAFKGVSWTMFTSLPEMLKFMKFMKKTFIPEYSAYKKDCETMQVKDAMEKHPMMKRYFHMKASEVIAEVGVDKICDNFISKFAYACTGSRIDELGGLDFLNVAQGVVIPLFDFTFDKDAFARKIDNRVVIDTITSVEKTEDGWKVTGKAGAEYTCKNLVLATTGLTTQKLLDIPEVRQPTTLVSYLVKGTPNGEIAKAGSHYYSDLFDIIACAGRGDGTFNVFSRTEIDLGEYFDEYEVLYYRVWPEALFTYGDQIQPQDWDENLWIAGDINGLGLEPAAISGIYAANRVLGVD